MVYLILVCVPIFISPLTTPAFVLAWYCEFEYVKSVPSLEFHSSESLIPVLAVTTHASCIRSSLCSDFAIRLLWTLSQRFVPTILN